MNCPVCNVALTMTDRQGVEIDYCPKCRGVWLDRGELDKLIERSATQFSAREPQNLFREDDDDKDFHYARQHRKRKSFLGEIFDFD